MPRLLPEGWHHDLQQDLISKTLKRSWSGGVFVSHYTSRAALSYILKFVVTRQGMWPSGMQSAFRSPQAAPRFIQSAGTCRVPANSVFVDLFGF